MTDTEKRCVTHHDQCRCDGCKHLGWNGWAKPLVVVDATALNTILATLETTALTDLEDDAYRQLCHDLAAGEQLTLFEHGRPTINVHIQGGVL